MSASLQSPRRATSGPVTRSHRGASGPVAVVFAFIIAGIGGAIDIATGPGLPIWWPFQDREHLLPYGLYFGVIACLAGVAVLRLYFQRETPIAEAKGLVSEAA